MLNVEMILEAQLLVRGRRLKNMIVDARRS
jgi:hypothetical protein